MSLTSLEQLYKPAFLNCEVQSGLKLLVFLLNFLLREFAFTKEPQVLYRLLGPTLH